MRYSVVLLTLLLLTFCAACGQKSAAPAESAPTEAQSQTQSQPQDQTQQPLTADVISQEEVQTIVFADAGVTDPSAVAGYRIQQDWENGKQVYEVEFYIGQTEYDYEVDAATGEILSYEADND